MASYSTDGVSVWYTRYGRFTWNAPTASDSERQAAANHPCRPLVYRSNRYCPCMWLLEPTPYPARSPSSLWGGLWSGQFWMLPTLTLHPPCTFLSVVAMTGGETGTKEWAKNPLGVVVVGVRVGGGLF